MTTGHLLGGRYQVGELLGYGGMAEVHRGRDLRLGRDVAIKMLRTDLARDATFQERFRREAQNAASLNHPAIVAVYDTGEEHAPTGETLPYIVMEFVSGRTLKEVLASEGRLMPRRALEITADICAALDFSHRHGIIHRDIKPGNVMLTPNGQVKVMDFGIARALASGAATMTQTSAVIGTAQYLSPEQARGESVDPRSDVYATGCVLYELLTGHPPFVGDNPVSVAYQHVREDPLPPSTGNHDVGPDIDAVVLKALAKNRANRYQSAGEMRGDLLRAANGRPVLATPVMRDEDRTAIVAPPPRALPVTRPTGTVARVGNAQRRRASNWVLVALTILGLLALAALGTGLYLANRGSSVTVPPLKGKTSQQAVSLLNSVNLQGNPQTVNNATCTQNTVVDQSPPAGRKIQPGNTVTYQVCGGPGKVSIPQITGDTEQQARNALKNANLTAKAVQVDGLRSTKGTVVNVDPGEGTQVDVGSSVTISISRGNQGQVPDVTGHTQNDAIAMLQQAGFNNVDTQTAVDTTGNQVGLVISQSPAANSTRNLGDKITIFVGIAASPSPSTSVTS